MSLAYSPENRQAVTGHTAEANMWRRGERFTRCAQKEHWEQEVNITDGSVTAVLSFSVCER